MQTLYYNKDIQSFNLDNISASHWSASAYLGTLLNVLLDPLKGFLHTSRALSLLLVFLRLLTKMTTTTG